MPRLFLSNRRRVAVGLGVFLLVTVWLSYRAHRLEDELERAQEETTHSLRGRPAPDFSLPRLEPTGAHPEEPARGEVQLGDYRGKVVLVSFWASWCRPCDYELPLLNRFYLANRDRGVEVIGISTDGDRAAALRYAQERGFAVLMLWDEHGRVAELYKVDALPTLVVIGPDGRIHQYEQGLRMDLESWLQAQVRKIAPGTAGRPAGAS